MSNIFEWAADGYPCGRGGVEREACAAHGEDVYFERRWQRLQTVTLFVAIMALCAAVWMARGKWDQAEQDRRETMRIESRTRL